MKVLTCYNCGSDQRDFYAKENGFSLVKCRGCGLLYVEERPDDEKISQAHKQGKHAGEKEFDATGKFDGGRVSEYTGVLKDLFQAEPMRSTTWLDVGCGHGEFIAAIQKFSPGQIAVRGTEPNVGKQQAAQKRGLDVGYFDLDSHKEKYDVVSLLNVYSHLPDPPAFIRTLAGLLNPGGELILETGDVAHISARILHRPLSLPDHLSFGSEGIIVGMLEKIGFEIVCIKKYSAAKSVIKEFVKLFVPGYPSKLLYAFMPPTDMFIRARLKA